MLFGMYFNVLDTDFQVKGVSTISNPENDTLLFIQKEYQNFLYNLHRAKGCCVIAESGIEIPETLHQNHNFILTDNPRLMFAKIYGYLAECYEKSKRNRHFSYVDGYIVGENVKIGENTIIEPLCFIDHDVTIGSNTIIRSGTRIRSNSIIGSNCFIKENSVIGTPGFSFEKDENDNYIKVPQMGGVIIHDNVELGALSTVDSGAIEPTVICEQVKMMDHAHIAHNVFIGEKTVIGAGSTIAGSTTIGKNVWISPNCTITHKISIGDGAVIGLSARVHKSVPAGSTIINEGAEFMDRVLQVTKYKKKLFGEISTPTNRKFGKGHPYYK